MQQEPDTRRLGQEARAKAVIKLGTSTAWKPNRSQLMDMGIGNIVPCGMFVVAESSHG